jgi:hypothetical protein
MSCCFLAKYALHRFSSLPVGTTQFGFFISRARKQNSVQETRACGGIK